MDRRVFIYHPDERVRNIIVDRLAGRKNLVLHPVEVPYQLKSTLAAVPSCSVSVFLLEFEPDSQVPLYREVKSQCPFAEVILLIHAAHISEATRLVERGIVYDYLVVNPFYDVYTARIKVLRALERCHLRMRLVELQKQITEAKRCIEPAVESLTGNLSQEVKKDSSELKDGVSQVVKAEDARLDMDDLFGRFDSNVENKIMDFGENMVSLTNTFAEVVTNTAVDTVKKAVGHPDSRGDEGKEMQRVLVISDQSTVRDLLRVFLSAENLEVLEDTGGPDSVERAAGMSPAPDLILLDMDLEKDLSFEILSRLSKNEHLKGIPLILLTHTKTKKILKRAAKYGVAGIILKPFKFAVVKEKVEKVLGIDGEKDVEDTPEESDHFFVRWRKGDKL